MDVRAALKEAIAQLRAASVPSHTLAAELLLMHSLGRDRTWLYSHPESEVDAPVAEKFFSLVARRAAGEPVQYLTGQQEFWGLDFEVTPAVLIPRPETEHVVEVALECLGARGIKIDLTTGAPTAPLRIADVGTGSGCIAVTLAHELPHAEIFATDISAEALQVAKRNAARHGVADRIHFQQADLLDSLHQPLATGLSPLLFDLIASNPPYIAQSAASELQREVRDHEPASALFGGPTGAEFYARIIHQSAELLRSGGFLVLELGHGSAAHVGGHLSHSPGWTDIRITNDLAGIPRVISAQRR